MLTFLRRFDNFIVKIEFCHRFVARIANLLRQLIGGGNLQKKRRSNISQQMRWKINANIHTLTSIWYNCRMMLLSFSFEMQSMPPFLVSVVHSRHVSMKLNIVVSLFDVGSRSRRFGGMVNFFSLSFHFCTVEFRRADEWLNKHTESNAIVPGYIEMVKSHQW